MFDQSDTELLDSIFKDYKENTKRAYFRHINDFYQYFSLSKLSEISEIEIDLDMINKYILAKGCDRRSGTGYQIFSSIRKLFEGLQQLRIIENVDLDSNKKTRRESRFSGTSILSVDIFKLALSKNSLISRYSSREWEHAAEIETRNFLITLLIYSCGLQSTEINKMKWSDIKKLDDKYYIRTNRDHESKNLYHEIIPFLYGELLKSKRNLDNIGIYSQFLVCSFGRRSKGKALTTKAINTAVKDFFQTTGQEVSAIQLRNFSQICRLNQSRINEKIYVGNIIITYQCNYCGKESEFIINNVCDNCQKKGLDLSKKIVGYVYFIKTENNDFIKIGITKTDIRKRFSSIQSGNMYKLKILGYLPSDNPKKLEKKLHKHFLKFRTEGEWFNFPERKLYEALAGLNLSEELQKFS